MPLGSLSGFTVAITADRRREEQAALIARRGGKVLHGAVIRTLPLDDEDATRRATRSVIDQAPDVVVLSTALGVRSWCSAAAGFGLEEALLATLRGAEVIARGPKAVGAAVTAGFGDDIALVRPTYRAVLDALAARPVAPHGRPVRVAVQVDGDGSGDLPAQLARLGHDVVAVPVYRWELPEEPDPALRLIAAVADRRVDAVTFTSAHAVANFTALAEESGRGEDVRAACAGPAPAVTAVAVGPVTAAKAHLCGLGTAIEPSHPRLGAMVAALAAAFADRSVDLQLASHRLRLQGSLAQVGGEAPVELTDRERSVLHLLTERRGAVISKQALLAQVWRDDSDEHAVEVTVGRLRRRLGPAGDAIETVVRRGYRLAVT